MRIRTKLLEFLQEGMEFLLEGMIQIETEIGLSGVKGTRLHQEEKKGHTGGANHLPRELIDKVHHLMRTRKKQGIQDKMNKGDKIGAFKGKDIQSLQMVIEDKKEV